MHAKQPVIQDVESLAQTTQSGIFPAPWQLMGNGYVVAVWMPNRNNTVEQSEQALSRKIIHKASLLGSRGRVQLLIFAHYTHSDAGPYDELLHIPQLSHGAVQGYPSIDKIYVSSMASVINGQNNWGIPKQLASFDYHQAATAQATESIKLHTPDQQPIARITFQTSRFKFPVTTALIPARLRTLVQDWRGKRFYTAPAASGQASFATVKNWWFDPVHFPDLSQGKVLAACKISDFNMVFPLAKITTLD